MIYGYALAKELFEHISISDYYVNDTVQWTFNEFESRDDCHIDIWLQEVVDRFFAYTATVGVYGDRLPAQLSGIKSCLLYAGNHEFYVYDKQHNTCYSWTHEEIEYRTDMKPEEFASSVIGILTSQDSTLCAWDPQNIPLPGVALSRLNVGSWMYLRDLHYAKTGVWLTKSGVRGIFSKHKKLTTPEFLVYVASLNATDDFNREDYGLRLVAAAVEALYSSARICFDRCKLEALIKRRNKSGVDTKMLGEIHSALDSDNMVTVPYMSRNKVTGRMFSTGGCFNPITLADEEIKACIVSRHKGGSIVVFDFSTFEPTLMMKLLGRENGNDIHSVAAGVLCIDREDAKRVNNMLFYGAALASVNTELTTLGVSFDLVDRYLQMMAPIVDDISRAQFTLNTAYSYTGNIKNGFGRTIWPSKESALFSNAIQSTGSDIFNRASHSIFMMLHGKHSELFMHRFDAMYIDIHPDEMDLVDKIVGLMSNVYGVSFKVSVGMGNNLAAIKALT